MPTRGRRLPLAVLVLALLFALTLESPAPAQRTVKPVLHGRHWVAITGKPLGATAGALTFGKGGNAVDAACSMLAGGTFSNGGATISIQKPGRKNVNATSSRAIVS